jgi:hypothetical protein
VEQFLLHRYDRSECGEILVYSSPIIWLGLYDKKYSNFLVLENSLSTVVDIGTAGEF